MTGTLPGPVWFIDTSSLLSMAVHPDVEACVLKAIGVEPVLIVDVAHDELFFRQQEAETSAWATIALSWIDPQRVYGWKIVDSMSAVTEREINDVQCEIADRPIEVGSNEHRAEAAVIALAIRAHKRAVSRGTTGPAITFLCEDFDARRVASKVANTRAKSITRLLRDQVHEGDLGGSEAEAIHLHLHNCGRAPDVTGAEFEAQLLKPLGRAGQPF